VNSSGHMHAIREELGDLLDAIDDAENAGVFESGSAEQLFSDLIRSSAIKHYEFATAFIRKAGEK